MDDDFFEELDRKVSNPAADVSWERTIGGVNIVFAPIDFEHQAKVNETLQRDDLGTQVLQETKRISMAAAIVGVNGVDLRKLAGKQLTIQGRDGKKKSVDVAGYMYEKMRGWDSEFLDACFSVFADLMESHRKKLVDAVTFENAKDPREELLELEARAAEIREGLGMPPLVEAGSEAARTESDFTADDREELEDQEAPDFDPFEVQPPPEAPAAAAPPPAPPRASEDQPGPPSDEIPEEAFQAAARGEKPSLSDGVPVPVQPRPEQPYAPPPVPQPPADKKPEQSPIERAMAARQAAPNRVIRGRMDIKGHKAQPSVEQEVVEQPAERIHTQPPKIDRDPAVQNRNPRFARQS